MKRAFIVHGWGGNPDEAWMPWLDDELTTHGFLVRRLAMPNSNEPTIDAWVKMLRESVGAPDGDTHFVGHSIGVQTILRYVADLPDDARVGKIVSVAGWFTLTNIESAEEPIAKPWLEDLIDTEKVKRIAHGIFGLFSDDDEVVPLENVAFFKDRLNAQTLVESGRGHYSEDSGITEVPSVLEFLIR